jgi:hypothetical protein
MRRLARSASAVRSDALIALDTEKNYILFASPSHERLIDSDNPTIHFAFGSFGHEGTSQFLLQAWQFRSLCS